MRRLFLSASFPRNAGNTALSGCFLRKDADKLFSKSQLLTLIIVSSML